MTLERFQTSKAPKRLKKTIWSLIYQTFIVLDLSMEIE